mgnify:CR=1 FL=1
MIATTTTITIIMSLNKQQNLNKINNETSNFSDYLSTNTTTTDQLNFDFIKDANLRLKLKHLFQSNMQTQNLIYQTSFDRSCYKDMQSFSGKIEDFLDFFEIFLLFVDNTDLSNTMKLMYLEKKLNSQIINFKSYSPKYYVKALQNVFVEFTNFGKIVNEIEKFSANIPNSRTVEQFKTIFYNQLGPISMFSRQYELGIGLEIFIFDRFSKKVPLCITDVYMSTLESNFPSLHSYFDFISLNLRNFDDNIFLMKNNNSKTHQHNKNQLETAKKYTELLEIINRLQIRASRLPKFSESYDRKKRIEHLEKIEQEMRYVNNIFIRYNLGQGFEFVIIKKICKCLPEKTFDDFIRTFPKQINQAPSLSQLLLILESNVIGEKNMQRFFN